jgi:hypothetical protein
MDGAKKWFRLSFNWRRFCNNLAFVVQFTFAYVGTMAYMQLTRCAISRKSSGYSFVMCSALGASLLRMSPFGIWHNSVILIQIIYCCSFPETNCFEEYFYVTSFCIL